MTRIAAVALLVAVALLAALLLAAPGGNVEGVPTAPAALDPATPMQWTCATATPAAEESATATATPTCWPVQPGGAAR